MAAIASPPDEEAVSRWDGDGGSQPVAPPVPPRRDAHEFLGFVGLAGDAEVRDGEVSFPPGILGPYTSDLRRVRAEYDAASSAPTLGLLSAIAALYERIAFAPGGGRAVAHAYDVVKDALDAQEAFREPGRLCSRCRKSFPAPAERHPGQREEWWLCPPCHDRLIGKGSRARS